MYKRPEPNAVSVLKWCLLRGSSLYLHYLRRLKIFLSKAVKLKKKLWVRRFFEHQVKKNEQSEDENETDIVKSHSPFPEIHVEIEASQRSVMLRVLVS